MDNKWFYPIVIMIVLSLVLFFYNQSYKSPQVVDVASAPEDIEQIQVLSQNMMLNNMLADQILIIEAEDVLGQQVNMRDLDTKAPKFVYFYSELTCNMCVDQSFEFFNRFIDDIGEENAIILVESSSPRYITTLARLNKIKTRNIFRVKEKNIDFHNKGFFFVLNNSDRMQNTFVPIKEFPSITQNYFSTIRKIFIPS